MTPQRFGLDFRRALPVLTTDCANFFSSDLSLRSTFFTSSSAGNASGRMLRSVRILRTSRLFLTCSCVMPGSSRRSRCFTCRWVTSLAKSLALMEMVGRKSASGRLPGTINLFFMSCVLSPTEQGGVALAQNAGKPLAIDAALIEHAG